MSSMSEMLLRKVLLALMNHVNLTTYYTSSRRRYKCRGGKVLRLTGRKAGGRAIGSAPDSRERVSATFRSVEASLRLLLVTALVSGALWFRSVPFVEVPLLWAAFAVACAPWLAWKHWMVTPLSTLALFAAFFLAHWSPTFSVVVHPMRILFLLVAASCIDAWMRRARTKNAGSGGHKATVQPLATTTDSRRLLSTVAKVGYAGGDRRRTRICGSPSGTESAGILDLGRDGGVVGATAYSLVAVWGIRPCRCVVDGPDVSRRHRNDRPDVRLSSHRHRHGPGSRGRHPPVGGRPSTRSEIGCERSRAALTQFPHSPLRLVKLRTLLPLRQAEDLIRFDAFLLRDGAVGPADFDAVDRRGGAEADVLAHVIL